MKISILSELLYVNKLLVPLLALLLWLLLFNEVLCGLTDRTQAITYLRQFGYLEEQTTFRDVVTDEALRDAILEYQRFSGLPETGELDTSTQETMHHARCGVKDIIGHSTNAKKRRRRRYAHEGSKWKLRNNQPRNLRYRVSKYPSSIRSRRDVDKAIERAFKAWSDVTRLSFEERRQGRVNIDLSFEDRIHGDGTPFDGPENILAHAFAPGTRVYGGDIHFDDEERWSIDGTVGKNLYIVAVHEIGHSLGLLHSDHMESVMWKDFEGINRPSFGLNEDDIDGVQSLYGQAESAGDEDDEPSGPPPDQKDAPDLCRDPSMDTITRTQNGNTFIFKGHFYWKLSSEGIAEGYPRRISDDWPGLPANLDASLTWQSGVTFFFKGGRYWRFTNRNPDSGYPKRISVGFEGIPDDVNAAFVWSGNGKTYFFKGEKYWRYESNKVPPVSSKYPRPIANWNGLPNNIDAVFQRKDGKSYFFKGPNYYRFDDSIFSVDLKADPPYPRNTSMWLFDCRPKSNQINPSETENDMDENILERPRFNGNGKK